MNKLLILTIFMGLFVSFSLCIRPPSKEHCKTDKDCTDGKVCGKTNACISLPLPMVLARVANDAILGTIDPALALFSPIGATSVFDFTLTSDYRIYGSTLYDLYSVSPIDAATTLVGPFGTVTDLVFFAQASDLNLYGLTQRGSYGVTSLLYKIDPTTGATIFHADTDIPSGVIFGDMVYNPITKSFFIVPGYFDYETEEPLTQNLYELQLDGTTRLAGSTGYNTIYGLIFDRGTLYAYSNNQQLKLDPVTGQASFDKVVGNLNGIVVAGGSSSLGRFQSFPHDSSDSDTHH